MCCGRGCKKPENKKPKFHLVLSPRFLPAPCSAEGTGGSPPATAPPAGSPPPMFLGRVSWRRCPPSLPPCSPVLGGPIPPPSSGQGLPHPLQLLVQTVQDFPAGPQTPPLLAPLGPLPQLGGVDSPGFPLPSQGLYPSLNAGPGFPGWRRVGL